MSIKYRADIDGLRALAVLLVIFNHINISLFSGGFIGVDIFFVISGFLITSIIYKEMTEDRFSIAKFYKKRVIRLGPALFTVLATVSVICSFILLPHELSEYFKSLVYSTFLMANIYMRKEVGEYFATSVDEVPLLHLWSLGVEEQFYIFWPLILLLLIKKTNAKWLFWIVLGLIICSIYQAEYQILKNAGKAYYRVTVRACEMLLGALICFLPIIKIRETIARIFVWIGIIIVIACAVIFDEKTKFPGLNSMIPCLATAVIIYMGQVLNKHNYLLANPISTWIGKISYPMYLWHWPLIVFLNIYLIPLDAVIQLGIVSLTIIMAYATYKFIELPARKWSVLPNKKVIIMGFLLPAFSFSSIAGGIYYSKGLPIRFDEKVTEQVEALQSPAHRLRKNCHDAPEDKTLLPRKELCNFGQLNKSSIDILLLGDSHANSLIGAIDVWAKDAQLKGYDVTQSTTMYLSGVDLFHAENSKNYERKDKFKNRNDAITQHLKKNKYPIIVITGYYSAYLIDDMFDLRDNSKNGKAEVFTTALRQSLQNTFEASERVILILDVPELYDVKANCPARVLTLGLNVTCSVPVEKIKERDEQFLTILQKLQKEFPKLEIVDPKRILCDEINCQIGLKDIPLYRDGDDDHMTFKGSTILGQEYLRLIGNPLKD